MKYFHADCFDQAKHSVWYRIHIFHCMLDINMLRKLLLNPLGLQNRVIITATDDAYNVSQLYVVGPVSGWT